MIPGGSIVILLLVLFLLVGIVVVLGIVGIVSAISLAHRTRRLPGWRRRLTIVGQLVFPLGFACLWVWGLWIYTDTCDYRQVDPVYGSQRLIRQPSAFTLSFESGVPGASITPLVGTGLTTMFGVEAFGQSGQWVYGRCLEPSYFLMDTATGKSETFYDRAAWETLIHSRGIAQLHLEDPAAYYWARRHVWIDYLQIAAETLVLIGVWVVWHRQVRRLVASANAVSA